MINRKFVPVNQRIDVIMNLLGKQEVGGNAACLQSNPSGYLYKRKTISDMMVESSINASSLRLEPRVSKI